jgi:hypothetical protein
MDVDDNDKVAILLQGQKIATDRMSRIKQA